MGKPQTPYEGRNFINTAFIVSGTLLDNAAVGPYRLLKGRHIDTTDTVLAHTLGRVPTIYHMVRSRNGGQVYDASTVDADWTASTITLRATVAGIYSVLLC
jgi:hypothetical protein